MLNSVNNYGYNGFQNASALFVKAAAANPGEGFQGSKALENAGKGGTLNPGFTYMGHAARKREEDAALC